MEEEETEEEVVQEELVEEDEAEVERSDCAPTRIFRQHREL